MIDSISSISNLSINVPKVKSTPFNGVEPIQDKPLGRYGFEWDLKVSPTNIKVTIDNAKVTVFTQASARQQNQQNGVALTNSPLNHAASTLSAVMDDCIEMHVKEGTLQELEARTSSYDSYLQTQFKSSNIGGAGVEKRGLHIHVDIKDSFKDIKSQGRFINAIFNLAPVLMSHSRAGGIQGNCRLASDSEIRAINDFTKRRLCSITLPEKVMAQLQSELGPQYDKSVAINLEHSHFGQAGTYELRFLQSPDNPKQVYSLVKLVDAIVQQANSECSSQLFKQVNPMAYSNLESVLAMLANGDAQLKAEWSGLFVNKPRPVTTVERSPLDPRSQLASLVKGGNDEELANMLGKTGIQNFDIHGEDPVDYAKNQGLDHIIPVLQHYGVKPLEAKLKMHNAEFYQLIGRAQQLKLSPGQILKLFNHFSEPAIARALSAKAKRAKDEDCDKILQLSPKQQREYDKLTASCVGPALALKSVARIR
ncbi:MAG TPA: hypothetical protein DDW29_06380 [Gammaproteobacteria bacterium]|nr:hypothetical protein [Gammaproteobacteria bacterium]